MSAYVLTTLPAFYLTTYPSHIISQTLPPFFLFPITFLSLHLHNFLPTRHQPYWHNINLYPYTPHPFPIYTLLLIFFPILSSQYYLPSFHPFPCRGPTISRNLGNCPASCPRTLATGSLWYYVRAKRFTYHHTILSSAASGQHTI